MKTRKFIPLLVVAAGLLAYHNSFTGPFIYDDEPSILENPTIRHLWPIWRPLSPPHWGGITVEGRPIINLSLAVNYVFGGTEVRGYHILNLTIHILAGLTLLGIVRRTLLQSGLRERFGAVANELALAAAVIWTVHPLQTESVTYVIQRAESMMGLFYLLTLYCFIRGAESPRPGRWYGLCVSACALGMACKEVMVSAPLMVMLYDRTFLSGSLREAWRRRWPLYLALAGTWIVLGYLVMLSFHNALTNAQMKGVVWWEYLLTEPGVILHYLRLSVWPHPLCFDYDGWPMARTWMSILPPALVMAILLGAMVWAWKTNSAWVFLGAWFFLILTPSSSFIPTDSPAYEHRMYLSLAAVVALVVIGAFVLGERLSSKQPSGILAWLAGGSVALLFAILTIHRNQDYSSELAIWQDTAAKYPNNIRAHNNLGEALTQAGKIPDAIRHYEQALRLRPDYAEAHSNLGIALLQAGRIQDAIGHYEQALRIDPNYAEVHYNLGIALVQAGKLEAAIGHYEQALRLRPDYAEADDNLGNALLQAGRIQDAIGHYEQALRIKSDYTEAHYNLGIALVQAGRVQDAIGHYEQALRLRPDYAEAHYNLGIALVQAGKFGEAIGHYEQALRIKPNSALAHNNLGNALLQAGKIEAAVGHYEQALRIDPDYAEAHCNLGLGLAQLGRLQEAMGHWNRALQIKPDYPEAHSNLGNALLEMGKGQEGIGHYEQALRLKPDYAKGHYNLGLALAQVGRLQEAIGHYEQALQLEPNYAKAHYNLGLALAQAGKFEEAIGHYEQALRLKPDFIEARNALARLRPVR